MLALGSCALKNAERRMPESVMLELGSSFGCGHTLHTCTSFEFQPSDHIFKSDLVRDRVCVYACTLGGQGLGFGD